MEIANLYEVAQKIWDGSRLYQNLKGRTVYKDLRPVMNDMAVEFYFSVYLVGTLRYVDNTKFEYCKLSSQTYQPYVLSVCDLLELLAVESGAFVNQEGVKITSTKRLLKGFDSIGEYFLHHSISTNTARIRNSLSGNNLENYYSDCLSTLETLSNRLEEYEGLSKKYLATVEELKKKVIGRLPKHTEKEMDLFIHDLKGRVRKSKDKYKTFLKFTEFEIEGWNYRHEALLKYSRVKVNPHLSSTAKLKRLFPKFLARIDTKISV